MLDCFSHELVIELVIDRPCKLDRVVIDRLCFDNIKLLWFKHMSQLYDRDFYLWIETTVKQLQQNELENID
jgi:hypothetical protein